MKDIIRLNNFKNIIKKILISYGFEEIKNYYYFSNDELMIVIGLQKSRFSYDYYINYGFSLNRMREKSILPKPNNCDLLARFVIQDELDLRQNPAFDLESITSEELEKIIIENVEKSILPVIKNGITEYFKIHPEAKLIIPIKLKDYLNL